MTIAAIQSVFKPEAESDNVPNMWIHPIFDAKKGKLKTHKGRIEETEGTDNESASLNQSPRIY